MSIILLNSHRSIQITDVIVADDCKNISLEVLVKNAGWDGKSIVNAIITIDSGVTVSSDTSAPAITTGTFPAGSEILLNNMGSVVGEGVALELLCALSIDNASGTISGFPAISDDGECATLINRGEITE